MKYQLWFLLLSLFLFLPTDVESAEDTIVITITPREGTFQNIDISILGFIVGDTINYAMDEGMLFRGAISIGDMYSSKDMLIGPAIDDAVEWYDMADWAGVHLTPKASYAVDSLLFENYDMRRIEGMLYKYEIPLKNGEFLHSYAVNWPYSYFLDNSLEPNDENKAILIKLVLDLFQNSSISIKDEPKYHNTLTFLNQIIKEDWTDLYEDE